MRVLVCPADRGGCGLYRCVGPAEALRADGYDVEVAAGAPFQGVFVDTDDGTHLVDVLAPECDVIVLQRALPRHLADAVPLLQAQGVAVVVEVDDDFTRIDPRNVAYAACEPRTSPERNYQHLLRACASADLVTVSTPALAGRFAPHGRVAVVPNCVPASYLSEPNRRIFEGRDWQPGTKVRVGWSGSVETHPGDLEATGGALGSVLAELGSVASCHVIGTGRGVQEALRLEREPSSTGWLALEHYPKAVAYLDVGVVPLRACAFNRAKSWLKGLEMAACGVPFVASPLPEYERLATLGAGVLASDARRWGDALRALITNPGARAESAAKGRAVAKHYTIEANAHRWWEAWTSAAEMRRAA